MTTLDQAALMRAILAHPDEDTPRLILADLLQERGDEARAELIRVQCELATAFTGQCKACGRLLGNDRIADGCPCNSPRGINHGIVPVYVCTCSECDPQQTGSVRSRPDNVERLYARESALLAAHEATWRAGPRCKACQAGRFPGYHGQDSLADAFATELNERRCEACHGTGDAGGLMRELRYPTNPNDTAWVTEPVRVTFRRGFIHAVECRMEECVKEERVPCEACRYLGFVHCTACGGDHWITRTVPSDWLRSVLTATPERGLIEEVVCVDRAPSDRTNINGLWYWLRDCPNFTESGPATIPSCIFDHLPGVTKDVIATHQPTREAAVTALARAVVKWGRS